MASQGTARRSEKCRQRGPKTGITRVRTGCLTCRRRRKKCDERHPKCLNCEKTNVYCEGFPQAAYWQARNGLRNGSTHTPVTEFKEVIQHSPVNVNDASALSNHLHGGTPSYRPGNQTASLHYLEIGSNPEEVGQELICHFEYQGLPPTFETLNYQDYGHLDLARRYDGCNNTYGEVFVDRGQRELYQDQEFPFNFESKTALSPELPFPIPGIDTTIHRRLFCHFTTVMTSILTTFAVDCNPFKTIIIPLALGDTLVMDTLLCLAAVHLAKTDPDKELMKEKERIHEGAVQAQTARITVLMENNVKDSYQHDSILATSLLLCLYEICLGSGDSNWRVHLDTARNVINLASTATTTGAIVKTELNPFLLEFFVYHDSIASVTVPQASNTKPHFDSLKNLPVKNSSLVGVQDGLTEFIERISALRNQAEASSTHPNGDVVCKATQIWSDLNGWRPNVEWTQPRKLITTFYQRALVIWLFAILNPDNKADAKIQDEVHHICRGMAEIKPDDGVMACLLFPLFIVATAAISDEDRARICGHFERLRTWSSLGNVDLTFKIVRKMWVDHDENVPGSWDWVKQLHDHNLSFMVT